MTAGRRLAWAVGLMVLLPALALAGLAWEVIEDREAVARVELDALLDERLGDVERPIMLGLEAVERRLIERLSSEPPETSAFRRLRRTEPLAAQVFALDETGRLVFPPEDASRSASEAEFVARTRDIWEGRAILYEPPAPERSSSPSKRMKSANPSREAGGQRDELLGLSRRRPHGWVTWYWQDGLRLLFWCRVRSGVVGVEVERVVLFSHVLGGLSRLGPGSDRIALVDSRGDVVQQWGPYRPPEEALSSADRRLPHPLHANTLRYYLEPARYGALLGGSTPWATGLGLLALVGVIGGLGLYAYRESSRQIREAAQRVSFVTQVSHELKTPLSNIRLYAELLEAQLESEEGAGRRLSVIVSESQRLARLIDNILVFAKVRRGTHRVDATDTCLDDAVERVLEQFGPALDVKNIRVQRTLRAPRPCRADPDAIEQILANLVGNVEKYASAGRLLVIETVQDETSVIARVGDAGPGVPEAARFRIFEAFFRPSHALSDGVTGTGIGLTIARELAEEMGGTLTLLSRSPGAWFELSLPGSGKEQP